LHYLERRSYYVINVIHVREKVTSINVVASEVGIGKPLQSKCYLVIQNMS